MRPGAPASRSLHRTRLAWESRVRRLPRPLLPQSSRISSFFVKTRSGSVASSATNSNSRAARRTSRPRTSTRRPAGSTSRASIRIGPSRSGVAMSKMLPSRCPRQRERQSPSSTSFALTCQCPPSLRLTSSSPPSVLIAAVVRRPGTSAITGPLPGRGRSRPRTRARRAEPRSRGRAPAPRRRAGGACNGSA